MVKYGHKWKFKIHVSSMKIRLSWARKPRNCSGLNFISGCSGYYCKNVNFSLKRDKKWCKIVTHFKQYMSMKQCGSSPLSYTWQRAGLWTWSSKLGCWVQSRKHWTTQLAHPSQELTVAYLHRIHSISHNTENVKTWQNWLCQIYLKTSIHVQIMALNVITL